MLQDYRNYITNLRNSLIQCGVQVSINPLTTYEELFYEADRLSQIIWFYSVMGISGNELELDGFVLNLNEYYREKMRMRFYSEFNDYYESYKGISKLAMYAREGIVEESEGDRVEVEESGIIEEDEEEYDLFLDEMQVSDDDEDEGDEVGGTLLDEEDIYENFDKLVEKDYIPVQISVNSDTVSGTLLDSVEYTAEVVSGGVLEGDVSGTLLDEVLEGEVSEGDVSGTILDEVDEGVFEEVSDEDISGTILDDIETSDDEESYDDINYSDDEGEEPYDDIHYSDDEEEGEWVDEDEPYDDIHYAEDDEEEWVDEDEPYDDINYSDDDEEPYDDINYSDDEEEPYDDIHYSDDEDEELYDDINYSDDEEEPYDDIHYADDDEDEVPAVSKPKAGAEVVVKAEEKPRYKGDMSDRIQTFVNETLTKGKRHIINELNKPRNGN